MRKGAILILLVFLAGCAFARYATYNVSCSDCVTPYGRGKLVQGTVVCNTEISLWHKK